ncbi:cytochrome c oxidase subunit NDUFA4 isoform X1 [Triplophysa rosa]|uniref:cytochrome c oxidase subunit NDUFA4 isoform X1 n=1 Tax=Triplophysa rosa TaxID=992332 RepID=UPI0025460399|nr:cytochrome c oxidase subunit NDUFA4 isoform X1 [Triplophysa rosa]
MISMNSSRTRGRPLSSAPGSCTCSSSASLHTVLRHLTTVHPSHRRLIVFIMLGTVLKQLKSHPALIPLFVFIGGGAGMSVLYLCRLALKNPDCSIRVYGVLTHRSVTDGIARTTQSLGTNWGQMTSISSSLSTWTTLN